MNRIRFSRKLIFSVITVIAVLLMINVVMIYENSKEISLHKDLQQQTEIVKVNTVEMIRTLHLLDIGIRGYALLPERASLVIPYDTAVRRKDRILTTLHNNLALQNFPMAYYDTFKIQVDQYYAVAANMKAALDRKDRQSFMDIFKQDPGLVLRKAYVSFLKKVNDFENEVAGKAKANYERALRFSYWMQVVLFMIAVPTLLYLGYYSGKTFLFAERLHLAEAEKAAILENQNYKLELEVQHRTHELLSLNEEITTQNEEITTSNEQLVLQREQIIQQHEKLQHQHEELKNAQQIIQEQNAFIQQHNKDLVHEVDSQTTYLSRANRELKDRNAQLQQFAYIISHNLRGPLSRIQGLSSIMDFANTLDEVRDLARKMAYSTQDLDRVIKDLSLMIDIPHVNESTFIEVSLSSVIVNVKNILSEEITQSDATLTVEIDHEIIRSIPSYLESIFYNLLHNAIRYRNPERKLLIKISAYREPGKVIVIVEDNGLGIDTARHASNLFVPYKRFHLHVDGRGLGLYLVKTQVEALKGKIEIESQVDVGSKFKITFSI